MGLLGLMTLSGSLLTGCGGKDKTVENLPQATPEEKASADAALAKQKELKRAHPGMSDDALAIGAQREMKGGRR